MPSRSIWTPSGYAANHSRLSRQREKATEHNCVGCGKTASQWAQIHGKDGSDPFEHYQPMCGSCHRRYDRRLDDNFPCGHPREGNSVKNGRTKDGVNLTRCKACNKARCAARGAETRRLYNEKESK